MRRAVRGILGVLLSSHVTLACSGGATLERPGVAAPSVSSSSASPASSSSRAPECAPQECGSDDGGCDAVVLEGVWIWNGERCVEAYASGCGRAGPDCGALYSSQDECVRARASCLAP